MATAHELAHDELIESATGALNTLVRQQRRELAAATDRLKAAVSEHANATKTLLRTDVMESLSAVIDDLDRQVRRDTARGDLFAGTTSLTDLPHELRMALARAERAADRNERPFVVVVDRLPILHDGASGGVKGNERTRPRAYCLIDISSEVFE